MDFITPILDIFIRLWDCVSKDVNAIKDLKSNANALVSALDQLKNIKEDVATRVQLAEERQMVRTKQVDGWLKRVESLEEDVNDVLEKADQELKRSCCLRCLNSSCSRYKLGEEVQERLRTIEDLKNEAKFDDVASVMPRGPVDERPLEDKIGSNLLFEEVRGWIMDSEVRKIGIHGMGGVGKTTLLKMLNNDLAKTSCAFDSVIWVVVSKQSNVEKVQEAICEQLKLPEGTWKNKSEDQKSVEIFRVLRMKKFVIMLDDLWKRLDLTKVGIPTSDNHITSKIVFTTRYADVCGYMEANKKIKVNCLEREEAFALLQKKVGITTINAHPSIRKLAETVAEECRGLPLALVTVGRAMASKCDPRDWDKALLKLRKDPSRITGMDDDVFHILKFSYDSLRDDIMKSCFIYCCIYPEDHEILIDDLLDLWIGEGLLDVFDDIHDAREQGLEIIEGLKGASLLENGKLEVFVKMHDVIRDMALWISRGSEAKIGKYLVFDSVGSIEVQSSLSKTVSARISLWGSGFRSIPDILSWPNVSTLIVRNTGVREFPSGFVRFMPSVKVLDLSYNFHLMELPSGIGELVELQFLNISNTRIRELPVELKYSTKMKYLLLNATYRMEVIPREVISSFSLLRVFRISGSHPVSRDNTEHNILSGSRSELLEELESLQCLTDISVTLSDATAVNKLQHSSKIQNCVSSLCLERCEGLTSLELSSSAVRGLRNLERLGIHYTELQQLTLISEPVLRFAYFQSLRKVYIAYCDSLLHLTWLAYAPALEFLDVAHCASMTEIVKAMPENVGADLDIFSRLKKICLVKVPSLQRIYPYSLPFPSLVEIRVEACPSLRKLPFDSRSAKGSLKEIRGSIGWWLRLQWDDEIDKHRLHTYYAPEAESDMIFSRNAFRIRGRN